MKFALFSVLLLVPALAGCLDTIIADDEQESYKDMGFDGDTNWPSLKGQTLKILDHGAFAAFDDAASIFENLTGATVQHTEAEDTGDALNIAMKEAGNPSYDVIYGIDNILYDTAVNAGIFEEYEPLLGKNIENDYIFFEGKWMATPVDHGFIGINSDYNNSAMDDVYIGNLNDLRANADKFVTQDPRFSTPGLGFLLVTVQNFPDTAPYDWKDYWTELFANGVKVTSDWSDAYENHFTGGYGNADWNSAYVGGYPIVTSYTQSPAYEAYFGKEDPAEPLVAPRTTFHQIQTMGILKGTENLALAQAWIEFTLTDKFQELSAPQNVMYPVVDMDVSDTFDYLDPTPGTFEVADLDYRIIGKNLELWLEEWTSLCEDYDCA